MGRNHDGALAPGATYDKGGPNAYYRFNADGTPSNGSGCGNETASDKVFILHDLTTPKLTASVKSGVIEEIKKRKAEVSHED